MSVKLSDRVWEAEFPTLAMKLVALKLADYANDEGENIYPAVGTIERKTGAGASTVREALADMEACGLLVVIEEGCGNRFGRSTVIRRMNVALLERLMRGELVWSRVAVAVSGGSSGAAKVARDGTPKTRPAWRLVPAPASGTAVEQTGCGSTTTPPATGGVPLQPLDPTPPATGGVPLQPLAVAPPATGGNPLEEPLASNPHSNRAGEGGLDFAGRSVLSPMQPGAKPVDLLLAEVGDTPERAAVVSSVIGPIARQRQVSAPDPVFALRQVADWLAKLALPDDDAARIVADVVAARRATVKPADIEDAIRARVEARKTADGRVSLVPSDPACAAWLAYAARRECGDQEMARIAEAIRRGWGAIVPSRWPPSAGSRAAAETQSTTESAP